jgi:hypothetical protein
MTRDCVPRGELAKVPSFAGQAASRSRGSSEVAASVTPGTPASMTPNTACSAAALIDGSDCTLPSCARVAALQASNSAQVHRAWVKRLTNMPDS